MAGRKKVAGLTIAVIVVVIAILCVGCSASFQRDMKDLQSEYGNGLERTVKAYTATGEPLGEWEGKIDIEMNDNKVKFDYNGKRVIIYNAIVVTEEK